MSEDTKKKPKQRTLEEALDFEMPFGKYKGKTLKHISVMDPKYLDWATDFDDGEPGDTIRLAVTDSDVRRRIDRAIH